MITFIRTAVGMPGKAGEFAAFAKEIADIVSRVTGGNTVACLSLGGNANAVAWISQADSLNQMGRKTSEACRKRRVSRLAEEG